MGGPCRTGQSRATPVLIAVQQSRVRSRIDRGDRGSPMRSNSSKPNRVPRRHRRAQRRREPRRQTGPWTFDHGGQFGQPRSRTSIAELGRGLQADALPQLIAPWRSAFQPRDFGNRRDRSWTFAAATPESDRPFIVQRADALPALRERWCGRSSRAVASVPARWPVEPDTGTPAGGWLTVRPVTASSNRDIASRAGPPRVPPYRRPRRRADAPLPAVRLPARACSVCHLGVRDPARQQ